MKTYRVYVDITFSREFEVVASTEEEAMTKACNMADNCPTDHVRWASYVGSNAYDVECD